MSSPSVTCPQCQEQAHLLLHAQDLNLKVSDVVFDYYRCPNCKLVFLQPIPANLGDYYPEDYAPYAMPQSLDQLVSSIDKVHLDKLPVVQQFKPSGKLLEIGPGYGAFAYLAKQAGYQVDTVEMDAKCCQFLIEKVGVTAIQTNDPISAVRALASYDVIALWHVIEHVTEPWTLLQVLAEHLSPGGILVFGAPNPVAFQFRLFRSRWPPLEAPRHLQMIPIPVFEQRMRHSRLEPVLITTNDDMSVACDVGNWYYVFNHLVPAAPWLMNKLAGLLRRVSSPFERSAHRGSLYTLVFRKAE